MTDLSKYQAEVERTAIGLYKWKFSVSPGWENENNGMRNLFREQARAAIAAFSQGPGLWFLAGSFGTTGRDLSPGSSRTARTSGDGGR